MAARTPITINDGAATPVAHTFSPATVIDERGMSLATFEDRIGGIPVGYPVVSISMRRPSKTLSNYKVVLKIDVPTLETISNSTASGILPAPKAAYSNLVNVEFVMNQRSPVQSRKDLLAYARNLLAHAVVTSAVVDTEMVW